jgi:hypothetical protein
MSYLSISTRQFHWLPRPRTCGTLRLPQAFVDLSSLSLSRSLSLPPPPLQPPKNTRIDEENAKMRTVTIERASMKRWQALFEMDVSTRSESDIRACLREGVPPKIRRRYWQSMANWLMPQTERMLAEPEYSYIDLVVQPAIYWHAIKIDLERTFPTNPYVSTTVRL